MRQRVCRHFFEFLPCPLSSLLFLMHVYFIFWWGSVHLCFLFFLSLLVSYLRNAVKFTVTVTSIFSRSLSALPLILWSWFVGMMRVRLQPCSSAGGDPDLVEESVLSPRGSLGSLVKTQPILRVGLRVVLRFYCEHASWCRHHGDEILRLCHKVLLEEVCGVQLRCLFSRCFGSCGSFALTFS